MTTNQDLASTPSASVLVADRSSAAMRHRRSRRPLMLGHGRHVPSCTTTKPTVGRLVITRLVAADPVEPASISSVSVRPIRSDGPTPTVLHYRDGVGARSSPHKARGFWAAAAAAELGRPGLSARSELSARSSLRVGAPAAASTTGS